MAQVLPGDDLSNCPTLSEILKQCPCTQNGATKSQYETELEIFYQISNLLLIF